MDGAVRDGWVSDNRGRSAMRGLPGAAGARRGRPVSQLHR